jgi:hypothetical protein
LHHDAGVPGDPVKAALVQLPVQSHDYGYSIENVPLAAGYLAGSARYHNPSIEIFICPDLIANIGGDAAILQWIEEVRPEVIGFSCYLWNIERTLHLCGRIKERMEQCIIVLGGPEITPDNDFLLSHSCFDAGVVGEGEETFSELISAVGGGMRALSGIQGLLVREGDAWTSTSHRKPMQDLDRIPSPYLTGGLGLSLNRSMVMETVRGCPMRCTYCYYHKHLPRVRLFRPERIRAEFSWAVQAGIKDVTIIDPCFGRRPGLMPLLESMAGQGEGRPAFSCELNAEDLRGDLVDALARAGLVHVEIGLQSIREKTLQNVGRFFDREAFIRGVRLLKKAGVRVMTDIMVGLPGDRLEDVKRSIDFVLEEGLCDDLSLYPLGILPGTALRSQAARFGISYQPGPPYLVTKTADMDSDDIREAFVYAEEVTGIDYFPVEMPRPGNIGRPRHDVMVGRIIVGDGVKDAHVSAREIGQALCFEVRDPLFMKYRERLRKRVRDLIDGNPYTLVSWIIPEASLQDPGTREFIASCCPGTDHPMDREYMATVNPRRSCQLFVSSPLEHGGAVLTQIPLSAGDFRSLWANIPAQAGPDQELIHTGRLAALLGFEPDIRYHDFPEEKPGIIDELIAARRMRP